MGGEHRAEGSKVEMMETGQMDYEEEKRKEEERDEREFERKRFEKIEKIKERRCSNMGKKVLIHHIDYYELEEGETPKDVIEMLNQGTLTFRRPGAIKIKSSSGRTLAKQGMENLK